MGDRHYKHEVEDPEAMAEESGNDDDHDVDNGEEEASPPYENTGNGNGIIVKRESSYPMFLITDVPTVGAESNNVNDHGNNNYIITTAEDGTEIITESPQQSHGHGQEQMLSVQFGTINELDFQGQESDIIQFYDNGQSHSTVTANTATAKIKRGKRKRVKAKSKDEVASDFEEVALEVIKIRRTTTQEKPEGVKPKRVRKPDKRSRAPEVCHLCGHLSKDRTSMYYHHKYRHEKTRKYTCDICNKGFCQSIALKLHLRTHTGEKPYACTHPGCDERFSQKGSLKSHEIVHTGKKSFQCEICEANFSFPSSVSRHKLRAHTEKVKKIFMCQEPGCNKTFRQEGFLKTHTKLVHVLGISPLPPKSDRLQKRQDESIKNSTSTSGQTSASTAPIPALRNYPCDLCPAVFIQQSLLWQHDRVVHAHFRPYACFKCSRRFAESEDAKAHFLIDHGITVFPLETKNTEQPSVPEKESTTSPEKEGEKETNISTVINVNESSKSSGVLKCSIGGTARIETIGNNVYVKRMLGGSKSSKTTYREIYNRVTGQNQSKNVEAENEKSNLDPKNPIPTQGKKLKVLIIRRKNKSGTTDSSNTLSLTSKPIIFSNLLTLANVSTCKTKDGGDTNADDDDDREDGQNVIDTITIDEESPPSSPNLQVQPQQHDH